MRVSGTLLAGFVLLVVLGGGCASRTVVTRVDPSEQIDLSGQWNDSDSRMVSDEMIADCLKQPWRERFGKTPTIIAGSIRNLSLEHIPVGTFVKDIERALVNSGDAQVVASAAERGELREEKADQRINASPETLKQMGREVGADFMLIGEINQIVDKEKGDEVRFYQVDLSLVNIETNVKAWIGQKKIKKFVSSKKYKP